MTKKKKSIIFSAEAKKIEYVPGMNQDRTTIPVVVCRYTKVEVESPFISLHATSTDRRPRMYHPRESTI
jgi:hypothetical protein